MIIICINICQIFQLNWLYKMIYFSYLLLCYIFTSNYYLGKNLHELCYACIVIINSAMIAAHEVSTARNQRCGKAVTINSKTFEKISVHSSINLICFFIDRKRYLFSPIMIKIISPILKIFTVTSDRMCYFRSHSKIRN